MRRGRYPAPSQVECQPGLLPTKPNISRSKSRALTWPVMFLFVSAAASLARVHCAMIYSLSMFEFHQRSGFMLNDGGPHRDMVHRQLQFLLKVCSGRIPGVGSDTLRT